MFRTEDRIFIWFPSESLQRLLRPARVVAVMNDVYAIDLAECDLPLEVGAELFVFYEIQGKFVQQSGRIEALMASESDGESNPAIVIKITGDAVSAESRECYRVSAVMARLTAKVGEEKGCPLLDVSVTGFSAATTESYRIGSIVKVTLRHEGKEFSGTACVQSIKELGGNRNRYGFHCFTRRDRDRKLAKGLQQISTAIQRKHLRRLASTG